LPDHNSTSAPHSFIRLSILVSLLILGVRLITLPFPDLIDSTEGRYAAAALGMIEHADYLTPWINMGNGPEPYLGKPPMHFWLTAACFKLFGVSTFSARLPSFIATLFCTAFIFWFARHSWGLRSALLSILLYLSSGLTFFLAGAALLDTTLMMFITSALVLFAGFYHAGLNSWPRLCATLIGAALSGAFLTKGPVAIVIFLSAVLPWAFLFRKQVLEKRFPLIYSIGAFILLTSPWYLACESSHPGFLWYFIVKENLLRVVSENYGDRYGSGHPQFFATSFLQGALCFLPWTGVLLYLAWRKIRTEDFSIRKSLLLSELKQHDPMLMFVASWSLSMPVFLCFTTQYTANYLAPIMPGLALLLAAILGKRPSTWSATTPNRFLTFGHLIAFVVLIVLPLVGFALRAPWWTVVLSWSVIGTFYALLRSRNLASRAESYSIVSAYLALLYLVIILSFSTHISSRRSTNEILSNARNQAGLDMSRTMKIGFIGQLPFSTSVYGAIGTPRIEVSEVPISACCAQEHDFYIASARVVNDNITLQQILIEVGRTPKWRLLARAHR
jgi:4-amino-4-deoxy-L-arabinose transferase-like glycosyltransferase